MRVYLLINLCCLSHFIFGQNVIFSDDFDNYTSGNFITAESNSAWQSWSGTSGGLDDAYVSTDYSVSGLNSLHLFRDVASDDIVYTFSNLESFGVYECRFNMFVPVQHKASVSFGSNWTPTGVGVDFGSSFVFNENGYLFGATVPTQYPQGEWMAMKIIINTESLTTKLFINGVYIHTQSWNALSFNYVDFYAPTSVLNQSSFYIDDFVLENWVDYLFTEELQVNRTVEIIPNPNKGKFQVKGDFEQLEIINTMNQIVYSEKINTSFIEIELDLLPGLYFVQVKNGSEINSQKMIVK